MEQSGLVPPRDCLHRGGVHEGREAHVRRGASIPDPSRLFNSSLAGNTRRTLDIHEGEKVDADAFKALVKTAVARNGPPAKKAKPVKLLTGGNPQIAKADAHAPVQAYIAAMPGWKRDVGRRLNKPTSIPFNPQSDQERKLSDLCKLRKNWLRWRCLQMRDRQKIRLPT